MVGVLDCVFLVPLLNFVGSEAWLSFDKAALCHCIEGTIPYQVP